MKNKFNKENGVLSIIGGIVVLITVAVLFFSFFWMDN